MRHLFTILIFCSALNLAVASQTSTVGSTQSTDYLSLTQPEMDLSQNILGAVPDDEMDSAKERMAKKIIRFAKRKIDNGLADPAQAADGIRAFIILEKMWENRDFLSPALVDLLDEMGINFKYNDPFPGSDSVEEKIFSPSKPRSSTRTQAQTTVDLPTLMAQHERLILLQLATLKKIEGNTFNPAAFFAAVLQFDALLLGDMASTLAWHSFQQLTDGTASIESRMQIFAPEDRNELLKAHLVARQELAKRDKRPTDHLRRAAAKAFADLIFDIKPNQDHNEEFENDNRIIRQSRQILYSIFARKWCQEMTETFVAAGALREPRILNHDGYPGEIVHMDSPITEAMRGDSEEPLDPAAIDHARLQTIASAFVLNQHLKSSKQNYRRAHLYEYTKKWDPIFSVDELRSMYLPSEFLQRVREAALDN